MAGLRGAGSARWQSRATAVRRGAGRLVQFTHSVNLDRHKMKYRVGDRLVAGVAVPTGRRATP
jgi:hypothetical protein